ncbi:MAG: ThiF family adenylyltransferase [Bacilli bacterium]
MFERIELLLGKESLEILKSKKVLVIGLGGVGGYVVESLVRSGIENITLVDYDKVDMTNINRQIIALNSNIGKYKTDLFKERILDINPNCKVTIKNIFLTETNTEEVIDDFDFIIDACDTVNTKKSIIKACIKKNIKFISSMGTGKKIDPTKLEIIDIRKTSYDPLAKIIRKFIREEQIKEKIMVLTSKEVPLKVNSKVIPSAIFVPASAGLLIGSYVVKELLK